MTAYIDSFPTTGDVETEITVVIPVFKGKDWIVPCLVSLRSQTLDSAKFEVIFVFNGPDDGAASMVSIFADTNLDLNIRCIFSSIASASHARNLGTKAATGKYLTWVDCDDWLSAEYLELMLLSVREGIVPMTQIVNVDGFGAYDHGSLINRSIMELDEHIVNPVNFPRGISFSTCKLIPTWMAQSVPFDESLRSGEDVALYAEMFARYDFSISIIPALAGAKYFRLMRDSSVSRQKPSFDFLVTQRLDVITSLNRTLEICRPEAMPVVKGFINSQASFIKRYYQDNQNEASLINDEIASREFLYFPWTNWFDGVDKLVIAYNFLPYSDTGAMVTAKRIRESGRPVDVITHSMENVRNKDLKNNAVAQPYVQFLGVVDGPANFTSAKLLSDFCIRGMKIVESWEAKRGRSYLELYSRAMWPASHFLAALYKVRHPDVKWTAEFSDPIQIDSVGAVRTALLVNDDISNEILAYLPQADRMILEENMDIFFWVEHLAYLLADEIVFTNRNQLQIMADFADVRVSKNILAKSTIKQQPTLGSLFYTLGETTLGLSSLTINIGYFGEFYATRSLDEVVMALSELSGAERSNVCIHVFTSNAEAAESRLLGERPELSSCFRFHKPLSYFRFLNALTQFDCLIVNDALTSGSHSLNPYLPSKLSDYRGSGTRIWAVVEDGSILSELEHDFVSGVSDVEGAVRVLSSLASEANLGSVDR